MSDAKNQHLIPETYLKSWSTNGTSIQQKTKNKFKIEQKKIRNNYSKNHYYTILPGMLICEEEDKQKMFDILKDFQIDLDGQRLNSIDNFNNNFSRINEWIVSRNDKKLTNKEKNILISTIKQTKVYEIEQLWNDRYENKWNHLKSVITNNVVTSNLNIKGKILQINEFYKALIMRMVIAFNWRGFSGNKIFNEEFEFLTSRLGLKEMIIPVKDRSKIYIENEFDNMKHNMLLKVYRDFLHEKGRIYELTKEYVRICSIKFFVANETEKYHTSDNPSFTYKNNDGALCHVMPVTPNILITIGKNSDKDNQYYVERQTNAEVKQINKIIESNSDKYIIL